MILFNLYHGGPGWLYDLQYRKAFRIRTAPCRLPSAANDERTRCGMNPTVKAIGRWMRAHQKTRRTCSVLLIPLIALIWLGYVVLAARDLGIEIAAEWWKDFWGAA